MRPVIPFGGPGVVVKCDESKFNHKVKVGRFFCYFIRRVHPRVKFFFRLSFNVFTLSEQWYAWVSY